MGKLKIIEKESYDVNVQQKVASLYQVDIFRYKSREHLAEDCYQTEDNIMIVATSLDALRQWIVQDAVSDHFCEGQFAKEGSYLAWNEHNKCKEYVPKKISDLIHKILIDDSVKILEKQ